MRQDEFASRGRMAAVTLALFTITHTLLSADRAVLAILVEPIKADFHLSDSRIGLLSGLGFAFFFGVGGLPLGRLADSVSRRRLLAVCVCVFSVMTAAGGLATRFWQLFVTRLLVGAGEAGGGPAMASMMSDIFPPARRASAMTIYYAGVPLGSLLVFIGGGWLASHHGWRAVMIAAGLPGVVMSVVLWFCVREPARGGDRQGAVAEATVPFRVALRFIWSQHSLRHLLATPALTSIASSGLFVFAASYLVRSHHVSLAQAGLIMALAYGGGGMLASVTSGVIADRLALRDERWRPWYCALLAGLTVPATVAMALAPNVAVAACMVGVWAYLSVATYGPLMSMLQSQVAVRMRGTVIALSYLMSSLVGISLGSPIVGFVSDSLARVAGRQSLRYGLLVMAMFYAWGGVHFLMAARRFCGDQKKALLF